MGRVSISESELSAKKLTTIISALYAASFLVGITAIAAIVMNYLKGMTNRGHSCTVISGFLVLFANRVWIIYRIAKG